MRNINIIHLSISFMIIFLLSCNKDSVDNNKEGNIENFQFVASFYPSQDTYMNIRVDCKDSKATMTLLPVHLWGYPSFKISSFKIIQDDLKEFLNSIRTIKKYKYEYVVHDWVGGIRIAMYFHTYHNDTIRLAFDSEPENKDFQDLSLAILELSEKTVKAEPYSLIIKKVKNYLDDKANYLIQCEDPYYVILNETLSTDNLDEYKNLIKNIPNDKQVIFDFREVWHADDTILNLFKDTKFDKTDTYYVIDSSHVYNHITNSDYSVNNRIFDFLDLKNKKTFYNYDTLFASIFRDYNNYKYYPYLFNELTRPREGEPMEVPDYDGK